MIGRRALHVLLVSMALVALGTSARAQELVRNGGFESCTRCPLGIGVIEGYADYWHRGGLGSTDYYKKCGFYATPARTGVAHAGLIPWDGSGNYREYLTGELAAPLEAGRTYRVEFWVLLHADMLRAVQELGAYFSPTRPMFPGAGAPPGIVPQVENATGPLDDGDDEQDSGAPDNGVPLSFYQVDVATDTFRLEKSGTTIRFRR